MPLSFIVLQIQYSFSYLKNNLQNMFFLRLVLCNEIIFLINNFSLQIPYFKSCRFFFKLPMLLVKGNFFKVFVLIL